MSERTKVVAKATEAKKENSVSQQRKTELSQPMRSPADHIMFLQSTIGNQAVQRLLRLGALQTKLKISTPGDRYELEADRVAEQVIASKPLQAPHEGESRIQRKSISEAPAAPLADNFVQNLGPGQPLDTATRAYFEPRFGHDFSKVRVHTDARAEEAAWTVNALAYTVGQKVIFGAGQYAPETTKGLRLLAHELTHVVQQSSLIAPRLQAFTAELGEGNRVFIRPEPGDTEADLNQVLCPTIKSRKIAGKEKVDVTDCLPKGTIKAMSLKPYICGQLVRLALASDTSSINMTDLGSALTIPLWIDLLESGYRIASFGYINEKGLVKPPKTRAPISWKQLNPRIGDIAFMKGSIKLEKGSKEPNPSGDNFIVNWDHVGFFLVRSRKGFDYHLAKDGEDNPINVYHTGTKLEKGMEPGAYVKGEDTFIAYLRAPEPESKKETKKKIQNKIEDHEPKDRYEQEADRVTEQVMRMSQSSKGTAQVAGISQHMNGPSIENTILLSSATSSEKDGRLYSTQQLTVIENLKPEQIADYLKSLPISEKIDATGFERVRGQKKSFQNKVTGELLRFESNGLLCLETITYEYDAKKKSKISKKIRTYFDKKGILIETRINKEYVIGRQRLEQRFKQEEQLEEEKSVLKELSESKEPIIASMTVGAIWKLTNKFSQTLNLDEGVTKQLVVVLKDIIEKINTLKFDEDLSREKQEMKEILSLKKIELGKVATKANRKSMQAEIITIQERINQIDSFKKNFDHVTAWIEAEIKRAEAEKKVYKEKSINYEEEGYVLEAEESIASGSARQLCNIISYYLYGKATGKISKGESFGSYFIKEIKKGHIGLVKQKITKKSIRKGIEGASFGFGSSVLREQWGMYEMRGYPISEEDWKAFDQSGIKLAISNQRTGSNQRPNHFLLIMKDKDGVWRNMDHTSQSFELRGGKTDPKRVYGLIFDKNALKNARKLLEELMHEKYPRGQLI